MNRVAVSGLGATVSAIAGFFPFVLNLRLHPTPPPYLMKPPANAQALRLQGVAHLWALIGWRFMHKPPGNHPLVR